jgi:hypothetical protein
MLLLGSIPAIAKVFPHSNRGLNWFFGSITRILDLGQYVPTLRLCLFRQWPKPCDVYVSVTRMRDRANLSCSRNACDSGIGPSSYGYRADATCSSNARNAYVCVRCDSNRADRGCCLEASDCCTFASAVTATELYIRLCLQHPVGVTTASAVPVTAPGPTPTAAESPVTLHVCLLLEQELRHPTERCGLQPSHRNIGLCHDCDRANNCPAAPAFVTDPSPKASWPHVPRPQPVKGTMTSVIRRSGR